MKKFVRPLLVVLFFISTAINATTPDKIRIVTLSPHLAEWVVQAGGEQQLVGVSRFSDFPESIKNKPIVADVNQLQLEQIIRIKPSYVLTWKEGTPKPQVERLKLMGLNVVELPSGRLIDIINGIENISNILSTQSFVAPKLNHWKKLLNTPKQPQLKQVFVQIWDQPLMTLGQSHFLFEILSYCGIRSAFPSIQTPSAIVNQESVIRSNPDYLVQLSQKSSIPERGEIPAIWQDFQNVSFVKHHQVILLPSSLYSRPTPRLIEQIPSVCQHISLVAH
jgi:iron complex transport system substrate-binding protein